MNYNYRNSSRPGSRISQSKARMEPLAVPKFIRELGRVSNFNQSINWHMKDHVEIGHLIEYDAFTINGDRVMDLEIWFKIHTNVCNYETASPKTIWTLKIFISFVTTVKSRHAPTIWKKLRWKPLCLPTLKSITEIMKNFKSLYGLGGRCLKTRDICMDFEAYFKVHNLVSVHPKSIILAQMTNPYMIFNVIFIDLVKFETRPSSCWISERPIVLGIKSFSLIPLPLPREGFTFKGALLYRRFRSFLHFLGT